MGRSDRMFSPKPLNGIRRDVVFGLLTPLTLAQNSKELLTGCNPCWIYDSCRCWELNFDRLAFIKVKFPVCMP
jgi:hypothetical protein